MAVAANADLATEQEGITTGATSKEADFETLCLGCVLHCTEDAHIAFDRPANASDFLLKADTMRLFPVKFTSVSAIQDSTSGTLYILAWR